MEHEFSNMCTSTTEFATPSMCLCSMLFKKKLMSPGTPEFAQRIHVTTEGFRRLYRQYEREYQELRCNLMLQGQDVETNPDLLDLQDDMMHSAFFISFCRELDDSIRKSCWLQYAHEVYELAPHALWLLTAHIWLKSEFFEKAAKVQGPVFEQISRATHNIWHIAGCSDPALYVLCSNLPISMPTPCAKRFEHQWALTKIWGCSTQTILWPVLVL